MKKNVLFILLSVLSGCMFLKPAELQEISPADLKMVMKERDVFLVDVHVPEQKHIPGTDLFVPYNRIPENLHRFPPDLSTPIYLYCESGPMGNAAARELFEHGYSRIYNLKGGADAWFEME